MSRFFGRFVQKKKNEVMTSTFAQTQDALKTPLRRYEVNFRKENKPQ